MNSATKQVNKYVRKTGRNRNNRGHGDQGRDNQHTYNRINEPRKLPGNKPVSPHPKKTPKTPSRKKCTPKKKKIVSCNINDMPCNPDDDIPPDEKAMIVALDCEMVGIGPGGCKSALARVCIVSWDRQVLLDTFVKVDEPVTDFRTFVSGVRESDIQSDSAVASEQCRSLVQSILRDKILVGHGLKNDLQALGTKHPWYATRDTAKYEPFMKCNAKTQEDIPRARKLKDLAQQKLGVCIQGEGEEHSPVEDAIAALELYKLARRKWEKVMEWKINKTKEIERKQGIAARNDTRGDLDVHREK